MIVPVLPSADMARDLDWYARHLGFRALSTENGYAVLRRADWRIHLQWHADTPEDPLLGGSVIKLFVPDIDPWVAELTERGSITPSQVRRHTPWGTHEIGLFDLNKNAIFVVAVAESAA